MLVPLIQATLERMTGKNRLQNKKIGRNASI
jgi:hypothetical protein